MRAALSLVLVLSLAVPCRGAPAEALQFFACGVVQFFGEACVPAPAGAVPPGPAPGMGTPPPDATAPPPAPVPGPREAPAPAPQAPPPPPEPLPPLFPPGTVSPDMPPLLLTLLNDPTEAHARAFLAWHQARLHRLQAVQALLKALQASDARAPTPSPP